MKGQTPERSQGGAAAATNRLKEEYIPCNDMPF